MIIAWKFVFDKAGEEWLSLPLLPVDDEGRMGNVCYFVGGNPVYAPIEDEY